MWTHTPRNTSESPSVTLYELWSCGPIVIVIVFYDMRNNVVRFKFRAQQLLIGTHLTFLWTFMVLSSWSLITYPYSLVPSQVSFEQSLKLYWDSTWSADRFPSYLSIFMVARGRTRMIWEILWPSYSDHSGQISILTNHLCGRLPYKHIHAPRGRTLSILIPQLSFHRTILRTRCPIFRPNTWKALFLSQHNT